MEFFVKLLKFMLSIRVKRKKSLKEEVDSSLDDYRKTSEKQKKQVKKLLRKLPLHTKLGEFFLTDVLMDFDTPILYPLAIWE